MLDYIFEKKHRLLAAGILVLIMAWGLCSVLHLIPWYDWTTGRWHDKATCTPVWVHDTIESRHTDSKGRVSYTTTTLPTMHQEDQCVYN